jgi:hypothetical protein
MTGQHVGALTLWLFIVMVGANVFASMIVKFASVLEIPAL